MLNIKTCIFDIDGVLVDSAYANYVSLKRSANDFDMDLSFDEDKILHAIPTVKKIEYLERKFDKTLSPDQKREFLTKKFNYLVDDFDLITVNPFARDFIVEQYCSGKSIFLASNARVQYISMIVDILGIKSQVSSYFGNDSGLKYKPDPEMFITCSTLARNKYTECMIYEDTEENLIQPKKLGFNTKIITKFSDLQ